MLELEGEMGHKIKPSETMEEMKKQLKLAGPFCLASFLSYSLEIISVMFIGHLGELSLSAASMASSFAAVTGYHFLLGTGSALETFCGQAYGAQQYHMLSVYTQRAMLILMLMCIPISIIWTYTSTIFIWFGQDAEISMKAEAYIHWLIPSIFPYGILQCQFRFLQAQSDTKILMLSGGLTCLVHILVCWIMIFKLGLGSNGAALACAVSYWTYVSILAIYIKYSRAFEKTWPGFSKEAFKNLGEFISLSIPSALMICLEYWSYEFLVLMSGLLPNPKLETSMMSVSLTTSSLIFRIPYGFGSAVSTRVSNELGAGRPQSAQLAAHVVMFMAITEGLVVSLFLVSVRNIWGYLFTNEVEVVSYLSSIMAVLALSNFFDGIQGVLSGLARGCGSQKIGAFVNLGAYYLVGIPLATILAFVYSYGGKGLWMGIIGGSSVQALLFVVISMRTNWDLEATKAQNRVYAPVPK
uniref:protein DETOXIFICATION 16-like n=1 Tax=Erigeron canadensis TaxID=72917 RepID=UPI001CB95F3D|nr:protein DETOXIFICATION 16-like [Erigeron canadensis]